MTSLDPKPADAARVVLPPAHLGRSSSRTRVLDRDEPVRIEVRMPAHVAVRLFERAAEQGRPVSVTAWSLIDAALTTLSKGGDAME